MRGGPCGLDGSGLCARGGPGAPRGARGPRGPSRIGRNCLSHGWSVLWTLSVYLADRVYTRLCLTAKSLRAWQSLHSKSAYARFGSEVKIYESELVSAWWKWVVVFGVTYSRYPATLHVFDWTLMMLRWGWGGVGGAITFMCLAFKLMLRWGYVHDRLWLCDVLLALAHTHTRHATLGWVWGGEGVANNVQVYFHTHVMLRYCTFFLHLHTHTSCYVTARSSCTCTHTSCYVTAHSSYTCTH